MDWGQIKKTIIIIGIVLFFLTLVYIFCNFIFAVRLPSDIDFYVRELREGDDGVFADVNEVISDLMTIKMKSKKCSKWITLGSGPDSDINFSNDPFTPWIKIRLTGNNLEWRRHPNLPPETLINNSEEINYGFLSDREILSIGDRRIQFFMNQNFEKGGLDEL